MAWRNYFLCTKVNSCKIKICILQWVHGTNIIVWSTTPPPMRNTFVCNNHSKPWKWFAYCTSHFFSDDGPHYYRIIVHDKSHYTYAHMIYHNQCSELYLHLILGIISLAWVGDPNHNGYHTIYQPIILNMTGLLVWLDLTWVCVEK